MSKIRDKILRGEPATGSVDDLGEWLLESIESWTPAEREQARSQLRDEELLKMPCSEWIN
jgi:hypothetical protein